MLKLSKKDQESFNARMTLALIAKKKAVSLNDYHRAIQRIVDIKKEFQKHQIAGE